MNSIMGFNVIVAPMLPRYKLRLESDFSKFIAKIVNIGGAR